MGIAQQSTQLSAIVGLCFSHDAATQAGHLDRRPPQVAARVGSARQATKADVRELGVKCPRVFQGLTSAFCLTTTRYETALLARVGSRCLTRRVPYAMPLKSFLIEHYADLVAPTLVSLGAMSL